LSFGTHGSVSQSGPQCTCKGQGDTRVVTDMLVALLLVCYYTYQR